MFGVLVGRHARKARALGDAIAHRAVGHLHAHQPVALPSQLIEHVGNPVTRLGDVPVVAKHRGVQLIGHQERDHDVERERDVLIVVARIVPAAVHVACLPLGLAVDIELCGLVLPARQVTGGVVPGSAVGRGNGPAATLIEEGPDRRFQHRQVYVVGDAKAIGPHTVLGIIDVVIARGLQGRDVGVPHLVAGGLVGLASTPRLERDGQHRLASFLATYARLGGRRVFCAGVLALLRTGEDDDLLALRTEAELVDHNLLAHRQSSDLDRLRSEHPGDGKH